MQPHQQRVVDEYNELTDKINRLEDFLQSEKFTVIVSEEEQILLAIQFQAMQRYQEILLERIELF